MTSDTVKERPPALMSSNPGAALALLAAGTGVIALASIGVELWTGQQLAQTIDVGVPFVSAPMGIATLILAVLCADKRPLWSVPAFVLSLVYWSIFAYFG